MLGYSCQPPASIRSTGHLVSSWQCHIGRPDLGHEDTTPPKLTLSPQVNGYRALLQRPPIQPPLQKRNRYSSCDGQLISYDQLFTYSFLCTRFWKYELIRPGQNTARGSVLLMQSPYDTKPIRQKTDTLLTNRYTGTSFRDSNLGQPGSRKE